MAVPHSFFVFAANKPQIYYFPYLCRVKSLRGILSVFALLVVFSVYDFVGDLADLKLFSASPETCSVIAHANKGDEVNFETPCPMPHQINNSTSFTLPVRDLRHSQRTNPSPQARPHSANGSSPEAEGQTKNLLSSTLFGKANRPAPYHFSDTALYAIRKLRL